MRSTWKVFVSAFLLCVCATPLTMMASGAVEDEGELTVEWRIVMGKDTFFIGENITFQVIAYAPNEPDLVFPNQYAHIAVRNGTNFLVFDTWQRTDQNGTIFANWDSPISANNGTYVIIVEDGAGFTTSKTFTMLFDQDIYWQSRMDELEDRLDQSYEYLNYLFAQNHWLVSLIDDLKNAVYVCLGFLVIMLVITIVAWLPMLAERLQTGSGTPNPAKAIFIILGFGNAMRTHIDHIHEDMGNESIPLGKEPERQKKDHYCEQCDPDRKFPLTSYEKQLHHQNVHARRRAIKTFVEQGRAKRWAKDVLNDMRLPIEEDETPEETANPDRDETATTEKELEGFEVHAGEDVCSLTPDFDVRAPIFMYPGKQTEQSGAVRPPKRVRVLKDPGEWTAPSNTATRITRANADQYVPIPEVSRDDSPPTPPSPSPPRKRKKNHSKKKRGRGRHGPWETKYDPDTGEIVSEPEED